MSYVLPAKPVQPAMRPPAFGPPHPTAWGLAASGQGGATGSAVEPASESRTLDATPRWLWPIRGVLILLAIVSLAAWGRDELGRWQMAIAMNHQLTNDLPTSVAWADRAIKTAPQSTPLRLQHIRLLLAAGQPQAAFEACQVLLQDRPESREALELRAMTAQLAGNHDLALADADRLVELAKANFDAQPSTLFSASAYASALNTSAYTRAIAQRELDRAAQEIKLALELLQPHPELVEDAHFVDTRGYIHYLQGNFLEAQLDLELAVSKYESQNELNELRVARATKYLVDNRAAEHRLRRNQQGLAVMYHHRGLVYEALNLKNKAQQDRERAQSLGYAPSTGIY